MAGASLALDPAIICLVMRNGTGCLGVIQATARRSTDARRRLRRDRLRGARQALC